MNKVKDRFLIIEIARSHAYNGGKFRGGGGEIHMIIEY